jgi:regulator of replication initiation timing
MSDTPKLADALRSWDEAASRMETAEENLTESEASNWSADRRGGYLRGYDDAMNEQVIDNHTLASENDELRARISELDKAVERWQVAYNNASDGLANANREMQKCYKSMGEMTARVRELEAQLAAMREELSVAVDCERKQEEITHEWRERAQRLQGQCAALKQENDNLKAHPQPAAVGVVGVVRWGVESFPENYSHALVAMSFNSRESAEAERLKWGDRYRVVAIVNPNSIVPLESNEPVRWIDTNGIAWDTRESAIRYGKTDTINPLYEGPAQPAQEGGA